ncbi:SubName: Full=Uncharacterized protein {ECO:0000313/EMBL:CCA74100.1} [Serendipita indica DSM 11827]|nr:SubName: Full=Uncharacterized protein {ECO:0000313/EMBL:CCA74100.1} [Serendipita indica DSM 11827]
MPPVAPVNVAQPPPPAGYPPNPVPYAPPPAQYPSPTGQYPPQQQPYNPLPQAPNPYLAPGGVYPQPTGQFPQQGGPYPPNGYNPPPPVMSNYGYPQNPYPPQYYPPPPYYSPAPVYQQPPPAPAPAPAPPQTYGPICVVPGCQKPAWLDPNGVHSLFCGKRCRDNNPHLQQPTLTPNVSAFLNLLGAAVGAAGLSTRACVICKIRPYDQTRNSLFCSPACVQTSETMAPGIIEIPSDHPKFKDVANQFDTKWTHTNMAPKTAKFIYLILMNATQNASYNAYRDRVEQEGGFAAKGRTPGNENRRFHGTTRACLLGDPGNTQLCSDSTCGLCGIIRTSFDLKFYKGKTGWGRFGCGLYTSATSSKSDSYTSNKKTSQYKAMLLSKVIVGNGYKLTNNSTQLTGPPAGYHSVLGEPDTAGALNYDELV